MIGKIAGHYFFGSPYHYLKPALGAIKDLSGKGIDPGRNMQILFRLEKKFNKISDLHHEKCPHKGQMKGKYETSRKRLLRSADWLLYMIVTNRATKRKFYDL